MGQPPVPSLSCDCVIARSPPGSGNGATFGELGCTPCFGRKHVAQCFDGVPYIHIARVKRREAEAQDARLTIIADHVARDQRLHDLITMRMFKARLRSAFSVRPWRDKLQWEI